MFYVVCRGKVCHMRAAFIYEQASQRFTVKKSDLWEALTVLRSRLCNGRRSCMPSGSEETRPLVRIYSAQESQQSELAYSLEDYYMLRMLQTFIESDKESRSTFYLKFLNWMGEDEYLKNLYYGT
jgi:hypothetical protein